MGIRTAQRNVPRPLIARSGGTVRVDLAIGADEATAGLEESTYGGYTDEHGEKHMTYRPPVDRDKSPFASFAYGANEVEVTECADTSGGDAYALDDIQPEPSEADGEDQNSGGRQSDVPRRAGGPNTRYRGRSGGIG